MSSDPRHPLFPYRGENLHLQLKKLLIEHKSNIDIIDKFNTGLGSDLKDLIVKLKIGNVTYIFMMDVYKIILINYFYENQIPNKISDLFYPLNETEMLLERGYLHIVQHDGLRYYVLNTFEGFLNYLKLLGIKPKEAKGKHNKFFWQDVTRYIQSHPLYVPKVTFKLSQVGKFLMVSDIGDQPGFGWNVPLKVVAY